MEIIDKYNKELEVDTDITMLNVRDAQMRLPAIKHKWVSRLINHKVELSKTKSLLTKAKDVIIEKQLQNSSVKMSRPSLEKNAETHETVIKLKEKIKDEEFIVMFLNEVKVSVLKDITFDIRNLIEILKIEQL